MTKIVISYRRKDSEAISGRIRDRLAATYGQDSVFMDIDSIPVGVDFREYIADALRNTDIMLVIIGPRWLGDENRKTRIQNPTDPVRIELEKAFELGILVWPVLVDDAVMPNPSRLPKPLKNFSNRNAAIINSGRDFHLHMNRLINEMNARLAGSAKEVGGSFPSLKSPSADLRPNSGGIGGSVPQYQAKVSNTKLAGWPMVAVITLSAIAIISAAWFILSYLQHIVPIPPNHPSQDVPSDKGANPPGAVACDQEKLLHSLGTTTPTSISFVDKTSQARRIYWLNFNGDRVLYATLQSGQSYNQQTYITHPWVVTDSSDSCIAIYMPAPNPQVIEINR